MGEGWVWGERSVLPAFVFCPVFSRFLSSPSLSVPPPLTFRLTGILVPLSLSPREMLEPSGLGWEDPAGPVPTRGRPCEEPDTPKNRHKHVPVQQLDPGTPAGRLRTNPRTKASPASPPRCRQDPPLSSEFQNSESFPSSHSPPPPDPGVPAPSPLNQRSPPSKPGNRVPSSSSSPSSPRPGSLDPQTLLPQTQESGAPAAPPASSSPTPRSPGPYPSSSSSWSPGPQLLLPRTPQSRPPAPPPSDLESGTLVHSSPGPRSSVFYLFPLPGTWCPGIQLLPTQAQESRPPVPSSARTQESSSCPVSPLPHRSPCTASWVAASSVPGWGPSSWWWPQRQTTGCSTGCRGPSPTRACGGIAWAASATCRRTASVRLWGRVWATPGVRAPTGQGSEPLTGQNLTVKGPPVLQMENIVAQRGKGTSPRSLSVEGAELGFQVF